MSWAARRRLVILIIVSAIIAAFLTVVLITTFYKTPSCSDGIQNQDEAGIDCGGPCAYLCTALEQSPIVLFTQVIDNGEGRTDIVAMVENKNATAAAKDVPYTIALYGSNHTLVGRMTGTLDLPPGATEPIYLSGVGSGKKVLNAFLTIAPSAPRWFTLTTDPRIMPTVVRTTRSGTTDAPRVEAILANPSATPLFNIHAVILVHDIHMNVIAASETLIQTIPAQGQATAIFTWNSAFSGPLSSIEIAPIIPLP